jgi:hypothetical protein
MLGLTGTALVISVAALGTVWFVVAGAAPRPTEPPRPRDPAAQTPLLLARTHPPASVTSVLAGTPQAVTAGVAEDLFAFAPVVVAANASHPGDLASAVSRAGRAYAPLLLTSAPAGSEAGGAATLHTDIRALHSRAVLAVGVAGNALAAQLPGVQVVTGPAGLPATRAPAPLGHVVLLVRQGDSSPATTAAVATAHAAGARVITVRGYDPRADPAAIAALSAANPRRVLAIGARFGPVSRLAYRIAVAATGVQLPGGGQIMFPMHRLVALYGHPGDPALGALGEHRAGQEGCPSLPAAEQRAGDPCL